MYNNDSKPKDINTRGKVWNNTEAASRLAVDYWSGNLQLSTFKLVDSGKGYLTPDKNTELKITGSSVTISTLVDVMDDVLTHIKTTKNFDFESDAAFCGKNDENCIQVTNGSEYGWEKGIYIVLCKGVKDNKTADQMGVYPVNIDKYSVKGFKNGDASSGKKFKRATSELRNIFVAITEYEKFENKAAAHFQREANKYTTTKALALLGSIAAANNISAASAYGNNNFNNSSNYGDGGGYSGGNGGGDSFMFSSTDFDAMMGN